MNTSTDAIRKLEQAQAETRAAVQIIDNLIAEHDYQDVASLITQAAAALLDCSILLMQSRDEDAITSLERADDLLDAVYDIIESELEDE